jgi:hypothetical protein
MKKGSLFVMILGSLFLVACEVVDDTGCVPVQPDAGMEPDATIVETDSGTVDPEPIVTHTMIGASRSTYLVATEDGFMAATRASKYENVNVQTTDEFGQATSVDGLLLLNTANTDIRLFGFNDHYATHNPDQMTYTRYNLQGEATSQEYVGPIQHLISNGRRWAGLNMVDNGSRPYIEGFIAEDSNGWVSHEPIMPHIYTAEWLSLGPAIITDDLLMWTVSMADGLNDASLSVGILVRSSASTPMILVTKGHKDIEDGSVAAPTANSIHQVSPDKFVISWTVFDGSDPTFGSSYLTKITAAGLVVATRKVPFVNGFTPDGQGGIVGVYHDMASMDPSRQTLRVFRFGSDLRQTDEFDVVLDSGDRLINILDSPNVAVSKGRIGLGFTTIGGPADRNPRAELITLPLD